jgi:hypothetical protein
MVEGGGAEIGVSDHGPGIAPENLAIIFERFKQVGNAPRSSTKGFGLGLNIAKELVALNLGAMHVSSQVGEGSTFSFTLPPNDPAEVLHRHLDYLDGVVPDGGLLAAVRIEPEDKKAGNVIDELRSLMASTIRPLDLILETSDQRGLLVVGRSVDPDRFTQRLREATECFALGHHGGIAPGAIRVEQENTWPYPAAREQAVTEILQTLGSELAHV